MSVEAITTDPQVLSRARPSLNGLGESGAGYRLSPRRAILLQLLADGLTIGEAAQEMGITHGTAKNTIKLLKDDLGADTTEQAVAMGIRRKIIT